MERENKEIKVSSCTDCIFAKWWTFFANDTFYCSLIDNDMPSTEKNNIIELESLDNDDGSLNQFYVLPSCPLKENNILISYNF